MYLCIDAHILTTSHITLPVNRYYILFLLYFPFFMEANRRKKHWGRQNFRVERRNKRKSNISCFSILSYVSFAFITFQQIFMLRIQMILHLSFSVVVFSLFCISIFFSCPLHLCLWMFLFTQFTMFCLDSSLCAVFRLFLFFFLCSFRVIWKQ